MAQNTKVELTRELIQALLNETRRESITPAQLAAIYKRIIDIVDEDAPLRQQAIDKAQKAADDAQDALRQISEFAAGNLIWSLGTLMVSPEQNGIGITLDSDKEKLSRARDIIAAGGQIAGHILALDDDGHSVRLGISGSHAFTSTSGYFHIRLETLSSVCSGTNLRFHMMGITISFQPGGEIKYSSTQLRRIDIPVNEDFSFDPIEFTKKFNDFDTISKNVSKLILFKNASDRYTDIDIDHDHFDQLRDSKKISLYRAFDITAMQILLDSMQASGCNEVIAPVYLHSGDTLIGEFPAFFSRSRKSENQSWLISGTALFRYAGSIWSLDLEATPDDNQSEITLEDIHASSDFYSVRHIDLTFDMDNLNGLPFFEARSGDGVSLAASSSGLTQFMMEQSACHAGSSRLYDITLYCYNGNDRIKLTVVPVTIKFYRDGFGLLQADADIPFTFRGKRYNLDCRFFENPKMHVSRCGYKLIMRHIPLDILDTRSPALIQRGIMPLGARSYVYYRNNGFIKLKINKTFRKEDGSLQAEWDLSSVSAFLFSGFSGRILTRLDKTVPEAGDIYIRGSRQDEATVMFDEERRLLSLRTPDANSIQAVRIVVNSDSDLIFKDSQNMIETASGTRHLHSPSISAPEFKLDSVRDIHTLEDLLNYAAKRNCWDLKIEVQRRSHVRRIVGGVAIYKKKWIRRERHLRYKIGVFRIRFVTPRGLHSPWTTLTFNAKAGNRFRIL